MPSYETIKLEIANGVATMTLNRPDRMNAFTDQMVRDMIAGFDETDANDDVRAVIVTGEGRAFCGSATAARASLIPIARVMAAGR
jgi:enoyl-CoA hydratase/carnithine racemase